MEIDRVEASRVIDALRALSERIDEMLAIASDGKPLTSGKKSMLREMLVDFKADIKASAKRGKIEDDRRLPSAIEDAYYDPALREASARFMLKTNVSPRNPAWASGLHTVQGEISYYLWMLEKQYPKV